MAGGAQLEAVRHLRSTGPLVRTESRQPLTSDGRWAIAQDMVRRWKKRARHLKTEVRAVYLACRDPRVPWYTRAIAVCVVAYALSPIDLIPDPIPVLGYLDDLVLVPAGIALVIRMIPPTVLAEARQRARFEAATGRQTGTFAAIVIVVIWLVIAGLAIAAIIRLIRS